MATSSDDKVSLNFYRVEATQGNYPQSPVCYVIAENEKEALNIFNEHKSVSGKNFADPLIYDTGKSVEFTSSNVEEAKGMNFHLAHSYGELSQIGIDKCDSLATGLAEKYKGERMMDRSTAPTESYAYSLKDDLEIMNNRLASIANKMSKLESNAQDNTFEIEKNPVTLNLVTRLNCFINKKSEAGADPMFRVNPISKIKKDNLELPKKEITNILKNLGENKTVKSSELSTLCSALIADIGNANESTFNGYSKEEVKEIREIYKEATSVLASTIGLTVNVSPVPPTQQYQTFLSQYNEKKDQGGLASKVADFLGLSLRSKLDKKEVKDSWTEIQKYAKDNPKSWTADIVKDINKSENQQNTSPPSLEEEQDALTSPKR